MNKNAITYAEQNYSNYHQIQPSSVKGIANTVTMRNKRYLYNDLFSVFNFENFPTYWNIPYFRYLLFNFGSVGIVYSKKYGWLYGALSWTKLNRYYYPHEIFIFDKESGEQIRGIVGVNAIVLHCFDDFRGFNDIIDSYAERLANVEKGINVNIMNSSVAVLIEAENKKEADTICQAYSDATSGKPFVAIKKGILANQLVTLLHNPKQTFIGTELIELERTIRNEFLTLIGINNTNITKKAITLNSELNANNDEVSAIANVVQNNLNSQLENLHKISSGVINMNVKLRYQYDTGAWHE